MGNLASNWENPSSRLLSPEAGWTATDLDALGRELLVKVAASGVAIAHEQSNAPETLACAVSVGASVPPRGAQVNRSSGISGRCIREGRTQRTYDACIDPRVERAVIERLGIRSLVAAPIFLGSCCVGLVEAVSDQPGHFDADRVALVESAAHAAAELLRAQQKSSENLIPHNSRLPSSVEAAQEPDSPTLSNGTEESAQSEIIGPSSFSNAINISGVGDELPTPRGKFRLWCLVAAVLLIAIIATSYVLYRRTSRQSTISANRAQTSLSDLPASSDAIQQKQTIVLPPGDGKNGTDSSALLKAASRGVISDQLRLAQRYLKENGVQQNAEKAASWYIIAGENGSIEAKRRSIAVTRGMAPFQIGQIRYDVGKMLMNGVGTRKNDIAAYTWFELAKAAGEVRAEGEEETLKSRMQPAQVEEGKKRASTWLRSHARRLRSHGRNKTNY
ncbi:MAG TPA: GAF domain-containing protein [Terriglobales bacterium]|nr:GAF domain-containing protein [Terriglobales bacterium]